MSKHQKFYSKNREIVRLINANFVIRVYKQTTRKKIKTLVGAGRITKYMSEQVALQQFERALRDQTGKVTFWDRRVLRIEFIAK